MKKETLQELTNWFSDYVATFKTGKADFQQNIILKEAHSYRVCREILYVGENLGLKEEDLRLAESIPLLHDIGRFEQYARHQTFADHLSVNHAEFGAKILREQRFLKGIDEGEQELILRAIAYHNQANLPSDETDRCLFFSKLLRDADKLDIWQVFIDYYAHKNGEYNSAIIHNLPDTPGISDGVYADLMAMRNVNYAHVHNLNDFKLLQVGWIFDVNFAPTFQRIEQKRYLGIFRDLLPQSERIDKIYTTVQFYLHSRET